MRQRVAISSELRDRTRHPVASSFELPLRVKGAVSASLVAYSVPRVQTYTLSESNNYIVFSEDLLVYSRTEERPLQERLSRKTIRVPAGAYATLEALAGVLDAALRAASEAQIFFVHDALRRRYALRSTLTASDGTLRGFHVFASPILELFGMDARSDHLLVGSKPFMVRKADNIVQGVAPPMLARGDSVVIATLLPDGSTSAASATVMRVMDGVGFEVAEKMRFSDYLSVVHTGTLHAVCAPKQLLDEEPVLLLRMAPFNRCTVVGGPAYFASLNSRVMGFHSVSLPEPADIESVTVEVTDVHGQQVDVCMGEVFVEVEFSSVEKDT